MRLLMSYSIIPIYEAIKRYGSKIDTIYEDEIVVYIEERLGVEALIAVIINFDCVVIDEYDEMVSAFIGSGSYNYVPKKLDLNLKNRITLLDKLSIEEIPI